MTADRLLFLLVRLDAVILLCAAPCSLLPFAWMETVHRDWLGLGSLPDAIITRYMTRSLALVYSMHGGVILAVTLNWQRYRSFVPVLAWLHIVFGCAMLAVDLDAGVPWWWAAGEGPSIAIYAIIVLLVYRRASRSEPSVS